MCVCVCLCSYVLIARKVSESVCAPAGPKMAHLSTSPAPPPSVIAINNLGGTAGDVMTVFDNEGEQ